MHDEAMEKKFRQQDMWQSVPYRKSIEDVNTIEKLGRFGLDGSVNAMFKEKNLNQIKPHFELMDDFRKESQNNFDEPKNFDYKRMSAYNAQFLPQGVVMGERLQKTICRFRTANKSIS